jgi:hypothetical protein
MQVFLDGLDWNSQFVSVEDYVKDHQPLDGSTFDLVQVTVVASTSYRMIQGKPVLQSIGFAEFKADEVR